MRKALALGTAAASLAGMVGLASPASAACGANALDSCTTQTTVAVTVVAGTISILASPVDLQANPDGAPLGDAVLGAGASPEVLQGATLMPTTVTDTRTNSTGWAVTGTVSDFTAGGLTIAKTKAKLSVPSAGTVVLGTVTQTRAGSPAAVDANGAGALISVTANGINTVTYTPRLDLDVNGAAPGVYTGTLTQSVA